MTRPMSIATGGASTATCATNSSRTRGRAADAKGTTLGLSAITTRLNGAKIQSSNAATRLRGGGLEVLSELEQIVHEKNACALPGSTLKIDSFLPVLRRAVLRGFVRPEHAQFVEDGLLHGFDNGVDDSRLTGRRIFENYP